MSAAAMEAPPGVSTIRPEEVGQKGRGFFGSIAYGIGKAVRWVRDKIVAAYRWSKEKIVTGSRWLWARVKGGAARAKDLAQRGWAWSKARATQAWNWSKRVASKLWSKAKGFFPKAKALFIGAWNITAPFRSWIATPLRMAAAATAGLGIAWLFSPWFILAVGGVWLGYLLITANDKMKKDANINTATDPVTGETIRLYSDAEQQAITSRLVEVSQRAEAIREKLSNRDKCVQAGQLYLLQMRQIGNMETVTALNKRFRAMEEEKNAEAKANGEDQINWVWTAAEKGIKDEQKVLDDILAKVAVTEPVPAPAAEPVPVS